MKYSDAKEIAVKLEIEKRIKMYSIDNESIYIERPSKENKNLKNKYSKETNIVIISKAEHHDEVKPTHQDIFKQIFSLYHNNCEDKRVLLLYFDSIFYGDDPDSQICLFEYSNLCTKVNKLRRLGAIYQLMLVEQDINYRRSKYKRASLYIHGWLREMLVTDKTQSAIKEMMDNNEKPDEIFTVEDNMKYEELINNRPVPLWYL